MVLAVFLALVVGSLASISPWLSVLGLMPVLAAYLKGKAKGALMALLSLGLFYGLCLIYPKGATGEVSVIGLVVKPSSSYCLLWTLDGTYYVPTDTPPSFLSLLRVEGEAKALSFAHFEGSFDFESYLERRGVFKALDVYRSEYLFNTHLNLVGYRSWCLSHVEGDGRALASSFLFGTGSSGLSNAEELFGSGLGIFLSGAGLHLSFLAKGLKGLFARTGQGRALPFVSLAITGTFYIISGFSQTFQRLLIVSLAYLLLEGKGLGSKEIYFCAGSLFLLLNPFIVTDGSFYVPFGLAFVSFAFSGFVAKFDRFWRTILRNGTRFAFLVPIALAQRGSLSLGNTLGQLFMIPLSGGVFVLLIPILLIPWWGKVASYPALGYLGLLNLLETIPGLGYGGVSILFLALWYLLLLSLSVFLALNLRRKGLFLAVGFLALLALEPLGSLAFNDSVHFIDVGQGDATLVRKGDTNVLIDTGGSKYDDLATACLIPYFRKLRIRKLDAVLITHTDFDHFGALASLQSNFPIDKVILGSETFGPFAVGDIAFEDLNDNDDDPSDNACSGVYRFNVKGLDFLVMGDAGIEQEEEILGRNPSLEADVIRLGHHGSKTSSGFSFLQSVRPGLAVISVGRNSYGHPTDEVLERLERLGIDYWRTDLDGTLVL